MSRLFLAAFALLLLVGCYSKSNQSLSQGPPTQSSDTTNRVESEFQVGEPLVYKNLTIFPVTSRESKNEDRFITLDEGLQAGTVTIQEVGSRDADSTPAAAEQSDTSDATDDL